MVAYPILFINSFINLRGLPSKSELYLDAFKMVPKPARQPDRSTSASKRLSGFGLVNSNPVVRLTAVALSFAVLSEFFTQQIEFL
jgi:hypothetical protein